jgi:hypothetical protein
MKVSLFDAGVYWFWQKSGVDRKHDAESSVNFSMEFRFAAKLLRKNWALRRSDKCLLNLARNAGRARCRGAPVDRLSLWLGKLVSTA